MKRFFKFTIYLLVLLLIATSVIVISGWGWSIHKGDHFNIPPEVEIVKKNMISIGGNIIATLDFKLPIHNRLHDITVEVPAGMLMVGTPKTSWWWQWCAMRYRMALLLRPFKSGDLPAGVVKIHFSTWHNPQKSDTRTVSIPGVSVKLEVNEADSLQLADEYKITSLPFSPHWFWTLLLIPIVFLLWRIFHRHKNEVSISLSQQTKLALAALRDKLKNDEISPELIFVELTDLMKFFLEKRFNLSSSRETTQEFMYKLERLETPLPEKYHPFLQEFLNVADLVKFAKMTPDSVLLAQAINKAEELVDFTSVDEEKMEV